MLVILFMFLLLVIFIEFYYFTNKLSYEHRQLVMLNRQISNYKHLLEKERNSSPFPTVIQYKTPNYTSGRITSNCCLYLYPSERSPVLMRIARDVFVEILDMAEISNNLWIEISIPLEDRINNKGWIKYRDIHFPEYAVLIQEQH